MATNGKTRRPNRVQSSKIPTFKEIDLCKIHPTTTNYGKIAKGLRIKLGPKSPFMLNQLEDRGFNTHFIIKTSQENSLIDQLYVAGYDVEDLYAQLVGRIQDEILKQLPF